MFANTWSNTFISTITRAKNVIISILISVFITYTVFQTANILHANMCCPEYTYIQIYLLKLSSHGLVIFFVEKRVYNLLVLLHYDTEHFLTIPWIVACSRSVLDTTPTSS